MGQRIVYLPLYKLQRTSSILFLGQGEVLTAEDDKGKPTFVEVDGDAIVLNIRRSGQERDAIFHERFHYAEY